MPANSGQNCPKLAKSLKPTCCSTFNLKFQRWVQVDHLRVMVRMFPLLCVFWKCGWIFSLWIQPDEQSPGKNTLLVAMTFQWTMRTLLLELIGPSSQSSSDESLERFFFISTSGTNLTTFIHVYMLVWQRPSALMFCLVTTTRTFLLGRITPTLADSFGHFTHFS